MTFRVVHQPSPNQARCPYRVIVQTTGREIGWINQYLDYETLRRLADTTLLPDGPSRNCLDRLSNRLTKILSETRKLNPPQ